MDRFPDLLHTAIDARDPRALAEFYRRFLGLSYRPGDEPPTDGSDDADWLVLVDDAGRRVLAVQGQPELTPSTWPSERVPMQMHMDFEVASVDELTRHRRRAEELGATVLSERTDEPQEPLIVLADPEGHPFCLLTVVTPDET